MSLPAISQKKYFTEHPVYFDIIKQYVFVFSQKDSSIRTNKGDQNTAYIKVFDMTPKGKMKFIFYDTSLNAIIKGQYIEAQKLSLPTKFTRVGDRVRTGNNGISSSYYKPLKDGTWFYYDENEKLIKEEIYERGKLKRVREKK